MLHGFSRMVVVDSGGVVLASGSWREGGICSKEV
jgi:hypothetical protein